MSTYAIGDIQGCYDALLNLLEHISFDRQQDILWFTGDLVNRGKKSLEVLRFVQALGEKHVVTLGNHDLHLLAVALGLAPLKHSDTLTSILSAPDRDSLINWICTRPLLYLDAMTGYVMVHAGLAPAWSLQEACSLAREVEVMLRETPTLFLKEMYGNYPAKWEPSLAGMDRLRCITNYLTRMRYCYADGSLELHFKGKIVDKPSNVMPWFDVPGRKNRNIKIVFGHWAALEGRTDIENVFPLDTGCIWGNCLTAMRLEDGKLFSVSCDKENN